MKKMNVLILYGGKSGEHEVSLRSAASIFDSIDRKRYFPILVGVTREGTWYLQNDPMDRKPGEPLAIREDETRLVTGIPGNGLFCGGLRISADVVFPVLHGTFGEDGTVQGFLEVLDLPYVGAGVLGSGIGMDKEVAKRLWLHEGLPVVPFIPARAEIHSDRGEAMKLADLAETRFHFPVFIKPSCTGSSVGVSKVDSRAAFYAALLEAFRYDTKALVEPAVRGKEIECSVIGNRKVRSFTPGQVIPSHEFYDYDAKYTDPDGARLVIPADISGEECREVRRIAEAAYLAVEAEGMARVDFFIEEPTGKILLNEMNTIPGFTNISMFPMMCAEGGLPMCDLITELIVSALARHKQRHALSFSRTGER
jgi:D-alanine-D-alanine ligase